jgi:hypothetical protein
MAKVNKYGRKYKLNMKEIISMEKSMVKVDIKKVRTYIRVILKIINSLNMVNIN